MPEPVSTTSFLSSAWLKPLWEKLQKIRGARDQEIQQILKDFDDPRQLARFYIEPDCQQINPANRHEDTEPQSVVKCPVFKTINDFLAGEFAVAAAGRNQMFVLSDAGMGKSSLLVMLKLAQLLKFWPSKIHCELLKLGPDTLERLKAISAPGDTVLLLDALDEDRTAWGNIRARLLELLAATHSFRRVILSCRTQFFPETEKDTFQVLGRVKVDGFSCPMIFLSLFDQEQVGKYLEKRYPDGLLHWFSENSKKVKASQLVGQMRDLCCRPMLLAHVEDLVDSKLLVGEWGEYQVYQALTEAWLEREQRKLAEQGISGVTTKALRTACWAAAEHLQRKGERTLSEKDLNLLIAQHEAVGHLSKLHFGGRSLLNRNADGHYRFSHFSIQEFLVAQKILEDARELERVVVPETATEKVIRFVLDGRAGVCRGKPLTLRGVNLRRFDFRGADLQGADLSFAKLAGANLSAANLSQADLTNADLSGAKAAGARFENVKADGLVLTTAVEGLPFSWPIRGANKTVPMEFVWIPAGEFEMGAAKSNWDNERPVHRVRIASGFWLAKYPVTQEQYAALIGKNPSHFTASGSTAPVEQVSWEDAVEFCRRVGTLAAEPGAADAIVARLPTEAEWEYACRAESPDAYCFGNDEEKLGDYAWYAENSGAKPHSVGQKKSNAWGLHDMHGNVWEWCRDAWDEKAYQEWANGVENPETFAPAGTNPLRVLRGGSWYDGARYCRSAFRFWGGADVRGRNVGFRVCLARGPAASRASSPNRSA